MENNFEELAVVFNWFYSQCKGEIFIKRFADLSRRIDEFYDQYAEVFKNFPSSFKSENHLKGCKEESSTENADVCGLRNCTCLSIFKTWLQINEDVEECIKDYLLTKE